MRSYTALEVSVMLLLMRYQGSAVAREVFESQTPDAKDPGGEFDKVLARLTREGHVSFDYTTGKPAFHLQVAVEGIW